MATDPAVAQIPAFVLYAIGAAVSVIGLAMSTAIGALWVKLKAVETQRDELFRTALTLKSAKKETARQMRMVRFVTEAHEQGTPSVAPPRDTEESTGVYDQMLLEDAAWAARRVNVHDPRLRAYVADESTPPDPLPHHPRQKMRSRPR